jgi:polyisoprenoid-binding protein YceI
MTRTSLLHSMLGSAVALIAGAIAVVPASAQTPLRMTSARVTLAGTSNVHDYTATTTDVKVTRVQVGDVAAGSDFWTQVQRPGGLQAFEITIPALSLKSDKDGLDKNMYKALDVEKHPTITFRLARLEGIGADLKALGVLRVAGAEQDVVLDLDVTPKGNALVVAGKTDILMTDYGIKPPRAMLGMVRASPAIAITFEVELTR